MPELHNDLPGWAEEMREIFRGGTVSQFILHGNVFDLVPLRSGEATRFVPLKDFLTTALLANYDCVLYYSRGAGIRTLQGNEEFLKFLKLLDDWNQLKLSGGVLPRDPNGAMELIDRFIQFGRQRTVVESGTPTMQPLRTAVIVDFVQFIVPQAEPGYMGDRSSEVLIRLLDWASDPGILGAQTVVVLVAENLADVAHALVDCPFNAKLRVPLPSESDCLAYLEAMHAQYPDLARLCDVPMDTVAKKVVGLTRVNMQQMLAVAVSNQHKITAAYLTKVKKELIEKECYGLLDFIESPTTLDDVAGNAPAKQWLREDAQLIRSGRLGALPMGYLMVGRIGTGKTWLATCWAGEVGIPFVAFKNFRDKWVGTTEGNLEKIFNVLHALGQVVVFVDEADQITGRRGGDAGDSGLSGRIYGRLAQEMSDTRNRGRVIWVFATSRPDLLEVDLKRPGRLDVHIPLFPPQTADERQELLAAMAHKVKLPIAKEELPTLSPTLALGGNEMEALMVRALRVYELQAGGAQRLLGDILAGVIADYRPLPHLRHLEYMDLLAVKECTDSRFLPEAYRAITPQDLDQRIARLKQELGIE